MPDYEIKNRNTSLNLMGNRLGLRGPQSAGEIADNGMPEIAALDALGHEETLLKYNGGVFQQDRMIKDKRRSLDRALLYSYQAATIEKVDDSAVPWSLGRQDIVPQIRALINPNKLKPDYDDKILSVPFEHGFKPGDVFKWKGTGTYWLIYLQNLTELAYFRGDIRRCRYILTFPTNDGYKEIYAATRGPVETKINFIQKGGISIDTPNHSLNILMPKTEETIAYFKRYAKFYLGPSADATPEVYKNGTCWRVEATDWISSPGILEITAVEYYANTSEDDDQAGLIGIRIVEPEDPNEGNENAAKIVGETFIKPYGVYTYTFNGFGGSLWSIDTTKYPVEFSVNPNDDRQISLKWNNSYSGQFDISYGNHTKTIIVESLF